MGDEMKNPGTMAEVCGRLSALSPPVFVCHTHAASGTVLPRNAQLSG